MTLAPGTNITITPSGNTLTIASTGGGGGVTSVGLADSTGLFNITGSPVTSSGTLTLASFQSQAANLVFAAPDGSSGAPTFRSLVAADVPTLNQNTTGTAANVTGTVTVPHGGTGVTSLTAYALLAGGTTSTGVVQSLAGVGTSGQVLTSNGASALPTWQAAAGGGVSGPGSSVSGDIATFNGTSGSTIQDSGVKIDGSKNVTGVNTITVAGSGAGPTIINSGHPTTGYGFDPGSDTLYLWAGGAAIVHVTSGAFSVESGQLQAPDGNQSLPGITFTNEGNTGFYRASGSQFNASVNGTICAEFLSTGVSFPMGVDVNVAGFGASVAEGSNAKQGVATLSAGTVTVANTSVTTNSRIFLTAQSLGTVSVPQALAVTARTAATSFTITSASVTDTSVVAYEIFEPG